VNPHYNELSFSGKLVGQPMDLTKIIADLRAERAQIEEAILALERLARGEGKRRGRPPKWLSEANVTDSDSDSDAAPAKKRKKRALTPEARERMAEAQRKRWEAYRAGQPEPETTT
jgi:hypothetical protein